MTLSVDEVTFAYPGGGPVIRSATLSVPPGESGFLLGPSGVGKSTLLRVIAGLETAYTGSVSWNGASLDALPPHKRGVGMLFQEPALFPHLNAWQNVSFGLRYRGVPRSDRRRESEEWLRMVGLEGKSGSAVDALSGGERQRVALARTLAAKPRVVLLDEPMSALDRDLRDALGPRVKTLLSESGVSALWVTHDREEARRLGDRVWVLEGGRPAPAEKMDLKVNPP